VISDLDFKVAVGLKIKYLKNGARYLATACASDSSHP